MLLLYIIPGLNVWWRLTTTGIFLYTALFLPGLYHRRSASLSDIRRGWRASRRSAPHIPTAVITPLFYRLTSSLAGHHDATLGMPSSG